MLQKRIVPPSPMRFGVRVYGLFFHAAGCDTRDDFFLKKNREQNLGYGGNGSPRRLSKRLSDLLKNPCPVCSIDEGCFLRVGGDAFLELLEDKGSYRQCNPWKICRCRVLANPQELKCKYNGTSTASVRIMVKRETTEELPIRLTIIGRGLGNGLLSKLDAGPEEDHVEACGPPQGGQAYRPHGVVFIGQPAAGTLFQHPENLVQYTPVLLHDPCPQGACHRHGKDVGKEDIFHQTFKRRKGEKMFCTMR